MNYFCLRRDPNSLKTVDVMLNSAQWINKGDFTQQDVDEAILSTFQAVS